MHIEESPIMHCGWYLSTAVSGQLVQLCLQFLQLIMRKTFSVLQLQLWRPDDVTGRLDK